MARLSESRRVRQLEFRFGARRVPEMENLDQLFVFADAIINPNRGVEQFVKFRRLRYGRSKTWEILEMLDVVKEGRSKPFGCCWVISANVVENGLQVS